MLVEGPDSLELELVTTTSTGILYECRLCRAVLCCGQLCLYE